jgi:hypothetical protein
MESSMDRAFGSRPSCQEWGRGARLERGKTLAASRRQRIEAGETAQHPGLEDSEYLTEQSCSMYLGDYRPVSFPMVFGVVSDVIESFRDVSIISLSFKSKEFPKYPQ